MLCFENGVEKENPSRCPLGKKCGNSSTLISHQRNHREHLRNTLPWKKLHLELTPPRYSP